MTTARDYRSDFFDFEDVTYLAMASEGPMPRIAVKALEASLEWKRRPYRIEDAVYFDLPERVRGLLAGLVGGQPGEIGLTTGASAGLGALACSLEWQAGDEILIARGEFPAHVCTWRPLAESRGMVVRIVEPRGTFVRASDFLERVTPRTRLVSASLVRFGDGSLLDAATLAAGLAGSRCRLLLDISQICGAAPLDLRTLGADFAVCAGYKWLLGPYGAGFVWARAEHIQAMRPAPFYWMAAATGKSFSALDYDPNPAGEYRWGTPASGSRWDAAETASFFQLSAFAASLEFVVGAGPAAVLEHNRALLGKLVERLPADRCVLASPRDPAERGPYLCVAARTHDVTAQLYRRLRAEKIYVSLRNHALRVAPYLYNTEEDIERLLRVITI